MSSLRKQLRHQQQAHHEVQTMIRAKLWRSRLSKANDKWLVKKHMRLLQRLAHSQRSLCGQNASQSRDSKIVFNINMTVSSDHTFMHCKMKTETMSDRRRSCARSSSRPSTKNPACVEINCIKPLMPSTSRGACRRDIISRDGSASPHGD